MPATLHLLITGHVQGVFFRDSTKQQADKHGIYGWVRNLRDGRVEVLAQGDADALDTLEAWCRKGPQHANVESFETETFDFPHSFSSFDVANTSQDAFSLDTLDES